MNPYNFNDALPQSDAPVDEPPPVAPEPVAIDTVTILQSKGVRLTKSISFENGQVHVDGVCSAKLFQITAAAIYDFDGIGELLVDLSATPSRIVVHGTNIFPIDLEFRRRLSHTNKGDPPTLKARSTRIRFLDVDKVKLPDGLTAADVVGCARYLRSLMPLELRQAAMWAQATASHGIPGKENVASMRLVILLSRPVSDAEMILWFSDCPVDHSIQTPAQPIYVAAPIVVGGKDPVPSRLVRLDGDHEEVVPPEFTEKMVKLAARASFDSDATKTGGRGFENYCKMIGDGDGRIGFFLPIKSAVASYVAKHGSGIVQAGLQETMAGIICAAPRDPALHDGDYIEGRIGDDLASLIRDRCEVQKEKEDERGEADTAADIAREIDKEKQAAAKPTIDQLNEEYPFKSTYGIFRMAIGGDGQPWIQRNIGDTEKPYWIDQVTPICVDGWLENFDRGKTTSLRVAFRYRDGTRRTVDIPRRFSGKSWSDIYDRLCQVGVRFSGAGSNDGQLAVMQMLRAALAPKKIVIVPRPGWQFLPEVSDPLFVCPSGEVFGAPEKIAVELIETMKLLPSAAKSGTLEQWAEAVRRIAQLNTIPGYFVLGLCAGFAGALLQLIGQPTFGANIVGVSSIGKTTTLKMAVTHWGRPSAKDGGLVKSANATEAATEGFAEAATGTVLPLDELGLAAPEKLAKLIYDLAADVGRGRSNRSGMENRDPREWATLLLMSSEKSIQQIIESQGRGFKVNAGTVVRVVDLLIKPVTIDNKEFREIERLFGKNFGHAGPLFVERLIEEGQHTDPTALRDLVAATTAALAGEDATPIETRAAGVLGLLRAAGELAQSYDLLPPSIDIGAAIKSMWDDFRGSDSAEVLDPVATGIERLGVAIRQNIDITIKKLPKPEHDNNVKAEGWHDGNYVYLPGDVLAKYSGFPANQIAKRLHADKMLSPGEDNNLARQWVRGVGRLRVYALMRSHFATIGEVVTPKSLREQAEEMRRDADALEERMKRDANET
jgi:hypothetical protein